MFHDMFPLKPVVVEESLGDTTLIMNLIGSDKLSLYNCDFRVTEFFRFSTKERLRIILGPVC